MAARWQAAIDELKASRPAADARRLVVLRRYPPGVVARPRRGLTPARPDWLPAPVPGTAAAALARHGRWDFDRPADFDADDWWYRTTFAGPPGRPGIPLLRRPGDAGRGVAQRQAAA